MESRNGYLYVASNPALPGVFKIGATRAHPTERMEQLSATTSVPTPFVLAYYTRANDCFALETQIHEYLGKYRLSQSREFFTCTLSEIVAALDLYGDTYEMLPKTPFAELYASFSSRGRGDPYENVLDANEIAQCKVLLGQRDTITPSRWDKAAERAARPWVVSWE